MNLLAHITAKISALTSIGMQLPAEPAPLGFETGRAAGEDSFDASSTRNQVSPCGPPLVFVKDPSVAVRAVPKSDRPSNPGRHTVSYTGLERPLAGDDAAAIWREPASRRADEVTGGTVAGLLLSASMKMDALDWPGSLQDCEIALNHNPQDQMALMLRAIATVNGPLVGDAIQPGKAVGAGITAAMRTPDKRYATLVEYGLTEKRGDEGIKRVEKFVTSDPSDKCAYALLLTMHFQRWYWGEHPESLTQAIRLADEMQQQWPNDRVAMSVLFYLIGALGRGNRAAIDFASRHIMPGDDIYHKSVIRPRLIFDYPMHIQRPDLESEV